MYTVWNVLIFNMSLLDLYAVCWGNIWLLNTLKISDKVKTCEEEK